MHSFPVDVSNHNADGLGLGGGIDWINKTFDSFKKFLVNKVDGIFQSLPIFSTLSGAVPT